MNNEMNNEVTEVNNDVAQNEVNNDVTEVVTNKEKKLQPSETFNRLKRRISNSAISGDAFLHVNLGNVMMVRLVDGTEIQGKLCQADKYSLIFNYQDEYVLILKTAIATLTNAARSVDLVAVNTKFLEAIEYKESDRRTDASRKGIYKKYNKSIKEIDDLKEVTNYPPVSNYTEMTQHTLKKEVKQPSIVFKKTRTYTK